MRTEILHIIQKPYVLYYDKLKLIKHMLKKMATKYIKFVQLSRTILMNIDTLTMCLNLNTK